jgi:hypothetical protein
VGKGILKCPCDSGQNHIVPYSEPLLKDTARAEMLLDQRVEVLRVKEAGARSGHRRRRINDDGIVALGRALQIASPIVDHDMCKR